MARKDERGIVIPAPLQFNNPASASLPRYDDEHRGPAVTDAYELSHCRIDLAERSETWPAPANLPAHVMEFAQLVPEDQRADWLRREANIEEVDRYISNAMRSGELPIWVAPIGEPERLVAPGAMVEVDHATVVSGVYRPPNDRGWLYGRPLFVKKGDWVRFTSKVQAMRMVRQEAESLSLGKCRIEESEQTSGRDLLKLFPDQDDTARAFVVPLPAALPEIGTVMSVDEALSWLAHGKPSHDIEILQNAAGDLIFRDPSGAVIEPRVEGSPPPFMEMYRQANRALHGALRDGSLPAYVAPTIGSPLLVPRLYWNGVNPESLHHVYRGMTPDDHGAGCPILLSRLAFGEWRVPKAAFPSAVLDRAPSVKAGRPPSDDDILAKADEMKARGLDGRTIAKKMRLEPGFENVATTAVRQLIKGRWKPAGRPKKTA